MRTISSRMFDGTLLPPTKVGFPLESTELFAGKMPAFSKATAFGSTMQDGMMLLGNGLPGDTPAGAAPPAQFRKRTDAGRLGTLIACENTASPLEPGYSLVAGTTLFVTPP